MRRSLLAGGLLLAIYIGLSFLNSPRGYLGTDTGGKVATLEAMTRGPGIRFDPDIGYWAEEWDPDGSLHPITYTSHVGDKWVNVTSVPMLYLAVPLYELGGYRGALLLPMVGSVVAAFGCRALVRRARDDDQLGWIAFALAGLASPLTIYALDFWEHSWGVALMGWGLVALADAVARPQLAPKTVVAGAALFATAATMRTEAFVYGATAALIAFVICLRKYQSRRGVLATVGAFAVAGIVALGVLLIVSGLEHVTIGSPIRFARTATAAVSATSATTSRFEELLVTTVSMGSGRVGILLGATALLLLALAVRRSVQPATDPRFASAAVAGVFLLYVVRATDGLGFVPGVLAAAPLGILVFLGIRGWVRYPVVAAVAAVPLVIATQYTGGAGPQWGGRYLLLTSFVVVAVGVTSLDSLLPMTRSAVVSLQVMVTLGGLWWLSARSHDVERTFAALQERREEYVVSSLGHFLREGGPAALDETWLTALHGQWDEADTVLRGAGADRFLLLQFAQRAEPDASSFPGWRRVGTDELRLFDGVDLRLTSWQRVTTPATSTTP